MKRKAAKNQNAARGGLYSSSPAVRATDLLLAPERTDLPRMAELSRDLGDAALTVATALSQALEAGELDPEEAALVVLYAEVATELGELEAVLAGGTGIKPAALGRLADGQYDTLLRNQVAALELAFSQVVSATRFLLAREQTTGEGFVIGVRRDEHKQVVEVGTPDPILKQLAGHMRAIKRMVKRLAGIRQWKSARELGDTDLASAFFEEMEGEE